MWDKMEEKAAETAKWVNKVCGPDWWEVMVWAVLNAAVMWK